VLFVVGLIYIAMNYSLSRMAVWTERRFSRATKGTVGRVEQETSAAGA